MRHEAVGFLMLSLACGGGSKQTAGAGGAAAASANGSTATQSSAAQTVGQSVVSVASTTGPTSVTSTDASSSTGMMGCDPPPAADSLFALNDTTVTFDTRSMCDYRGDVLLVVNLAEL